MNRTFNLKNALLLAVAIFMFASCKKESTRHDYEYTIINAGYLFTRQYEDSTADFTRVAVLPVDSSLRFFMTRYVDTLYYLDTTAIQQHVISIETHLPHVYLWSPDTVARGGPSHEIRRIK